MLYAMLSLLATSTCDKGGSFFGFPYWYKYLEYGDVTTTVGGSTVTTCEVMNFGIEDIPLIGLAAVDIALRIAALVAIGYIIYGGVLFVIGQGESDKTKKARQTVINALIGLAISILSVAVVNFVGARIGD